MPGKTDTVAWDTCIFLAWLNNETRAAGEMEGVAQSVVEIENNRINLIGSSLIYGEIFEARFTDAQKKQFSDFTLRSNVDILPADDAVMRLVGELRDFYEKERAIDKLPPLCTPDAIHLATAIIYRVKAFYTFDINGSPKCRGLIPLSGNVGGYNLVVKRPPYTPPVPPPPQQIKLL